MTHQRGRPIASPLIAPAACVLILIAPTQRDLTSLRRPVRANVGRNFLRMMSAASIADVPCFLHSPGIKPAHHAFAPRLLKLSHREFVAGTDTFLWQHTPFRDALSEVDRSALVVAGFWFEHQVVATTLHALADSYDVYFVLDASPSRMQSATRLSQDRLIQAGATPVVVSQVIHEWSLEVADAVKTAALNALLLSHTASAND